MRVYFISLIMTFSVSNTVCASLSQPGDIAFTAWNADINDAFSFVALTTINPGESIVFTDNEWDGALFNGGEGVLTWTATSTVSAGSIVAISNTQSALNIAANTGLLSGAIDLNVSNEGLFAFLGSLLTPTAFLTAFASDGPVGFSTLSGTGLSLGLTAIDFNGGAGQDADIFAYDGLRTGASSYVDYLTIINDTANWVYQGGSGSQHTDGLYPDIPFDNSPFTLASTDSVNVPEPSSWGIFLIGLIAFALRQLKVPAFSFTKLS